MDAVEIAAATLLLSNCPCETHSVSNITLLTLPIDIIGTSEFVAFLINVELSSLPLHEIG
jgi:hypothetical protein